MAVVINSQWMLSIDHMFELDMSKTNFIEIMEVLIKSLFNCNKDFSLPTLYYKTIKNIAIFHFGKLLIVFTIVPAGFYLQYFSMIQNAHIICYEVSV